MNREHTSSVEIQSLNTLDLASLTDAIEHGEAEGNEALGLYLKLQIAHIDGKINFIQGLFHKGEELPPTYAHLVDQLESEKDTYLKPQKGSFSDKKNFCLEMAIKRTDEALEKGFDSSMDLQERQQLAEELNERSLGWQNLLSSLDAESFYQKS